MKSVSPLTVIALMLFALSLGVFMTSYLTPSYAADPTTFFSCEVGGGGCSIRLNTTDHIVLNATSRTFMMQNVTFLQNASFIGTDAFLNMTFGNIAFHQTAIYDCDFGALHAVCVRDHMKDGPSNWIFEGGTVASPQNAQIFIIPSLTDAANFELLSILGTGTAFSLNIAEGGTGDLLPFTIQMDSNDIITFSITNTMDFNSRSVSNIGTSTFVGTANFNNNAVSNVGSAGNDFGASNTLVGTIFSGTVNMNGNSIINVNSLAFDSETAGNSIIGDRASDLRIITTSDGTNSRGIESYTPLDSTAGIGTNILRMNITGGCAQGSCEIKLWEKLVIPTNNTLQVWEDGVRPADSYVVNDHAKVQITGLQLESEYIPNPFEVFNNGDVVCLKDWKTFTKCSLTYNKILGPIHLLPKRGITSYNNVSFVEEGETKYRLDALWEDVSYKPFIIVEGPYLVKVCSSVFESQLLIAGDGGCVVGVDSYSDIPPLMFPIGYAANDSKGGYVDAVIL